MADEGPFDKYLGPWDKLRKSSAVEDRTDEDFPWHSLAARSKQTDMQTPTPMEVMDRISRITVPEDIPPITSRLQQQAGVGDVGPISPEELMKFITNIEMMNPYEPKPQGKVSHEQTLERARKELKRK